MRAFSYFIYIMLVLIGAMIWIKLKTSEHIHVLSTSAIIANKEFLDKTHKGLPKQPDDRLNKSINNVSNNNKKPVLRIKYTNFWHGFTLEGLPLLYEILTDKYNIIVDNNNYDLIIDGVHYSDEIVDHEQAIKIFFTGEVIRPKLGDHQRQNWEFIKLKLNTYDLSIGFDFITHPKYLRIPLYYFFYTNIVSTDYDRGLCNPNKKYFACFLVSSGEYLKGFNDGCIARNRMFHKLSLYKRVESGGTYLNNIGKVTPHTKTLEWLSDCKFIIAYENQSYPGYVTEKPFQAYYAGAIPIYYAHPDGVQDTEMNKKALIYAGDFKTEDELVEYIKKVDADDELYCNIWNQKIITNPNRNYDAIKATLSSKIYEIIESKLSVAPKE